MKNEFVPYDRALKLKQLGFDEPCFGIWKDEKLISVGGHWGAGITHSMFGFEGDRFAADEYRAPTFSQAFRWFRDTHELHYDITLSINSGNQLIGYYILIHKLDGMLVDEDNAIELDHNTPNREEAELACLDKMIEIVELKQQKQ